MNPILLEVKNVCLILSLRTYKKYSVSSVQSLLAIFTWSESVSMTLLWYGSILMTKNKTKPKLAYIVVYSARSLILPFTHAFIQQWVVAARQDAAKSYWKEFEGSLSCPRTLQRANGWSRNFNRQTFDCQFAADSYQLSPRVFHDQFFVAIFRFCAILGLRETQLVTCRPCKTSPLRGGRPRERPGLRLFFGPQWSFRRRCRHTDLWHET